MSRIYLATSWRNTYHFTVLNHLQALGHEVYNFKSSEPMPAGGPQPTSFGWDELDLYYKSWDPRQYRDFLVTSQRAAAGYLGDFRGMEWADTCVLTLPSGRSAHLEAGYMKGRGKRLIIYIPEPIEPDLMYLLADHICIELEELSKVC